MDFMGIPLFGVMRTKLGYLSERQSVLAKNVANADTPGYRAQDIKEPNFKEIARGMQPGQSLPMHLTNKMHMTGGAKSLSIFEAEKRPTTYELNPNGNNVVIEEEMMRVAENQSEYQKTLSVYRKTVDLFKIALGKQGGA